MCAVLTKRRAPKIIGAILGVAGGLWTNRANKKAQAAQNAHNDPQAIRNRYEAAGVNPLIGLANANPNQTTLPQSVNMGSILLDAYSSIKGDKREEEALEIERTRLQMERERLQRVVKQQTLRPTVGGIYANVSKANGSSVSDGNPIEPIGERFAESLGDVAKVKSSTDPVHGRVGIVPYSTISEEVADAFGIVGEIAKPTVAGSTLAANALYMTGKHLLSEPPKADPYWESVKKRRKNTKYSPLRINPNSHIYLDGGYR